VEACVHFLRDLADSGGQARLNHEIGLNEVWFAWSGLTDGTPTGFMRDLTGRNPGRHPCQFGLGSRVFEPNQEAARRLNLFLALERHPEWGRIEAAGLAGLVRIKAVIEVGSILVFVSDETMRTRLIEGLVQWAAQVPPPDRVLSAVIQGARTPDTAPDGEYQHDYPAEQQRLAQLMAELVRRTTGGVQASLRQRVFETLQSWARRPGERIGRTGQVERDLIGPCRVAVAQADLLGILRRAGLDEASLRMLDPLRTPNSAELS